MAALNRQRSRRSLRLIAVVFATGLIAGLFPAVADAHAALSQSDPADGARLTEQPATVSLTFNEDIQPQFAALVVSSGDARTHSGAVTVEGNTVSTPLATLPAAGAYTVAFRAVSADGHPITGSYTFTYAPPATSTATQSAAAPGPAGTQTSVAAAPRDEGHLIEGADNRLFWIVGILVVAILAGSAVLFRMARSHNTSRTTGSD